MTAGRNLTKLKALQKLRSRTAAVLDLAYRRTNRIRTRTPRTRAWRLTYNVLHPSLSITGHAQSWKDVHFKFTPAKTKRRNALDPSSTGLDPLRCSESLASALKPWLLELPRQMKVKFQEPGSYAGVAGLREGLMQARHPARHARFCDACAPPLRQLLSICPNTQTAVARTTATHGIVRHVSHINSHAPLARWKLMSAGTLARASQPRMFLAIMALAELQREETCRDVNVTCEQIMSMKPLP